MIKVAVVILNWNGEEMLKRFLPSVTSNIIGDGIEIIVADNGSTDGSLSYLAQNFSNIKTIELNSNYGYAGGYNRCLSQIEAEYYLLLNSDVELKSNPLPSLLGFMDSNKDVAIAMPKILSQRSPNMFEYAGAAGGFIDRYGFPFCRGRILTSIEEDRGQYNDAKEIFWASGAALLIRSSVFHEINGFDEDFFAYMEEIDLCWRAKNRGYKVMCYPDSVVYHVGAATLGSDSPFKLYLNYRNSLFMLHKNALNHKKLIFRRMVIDGVLSCVYLLQFKFKALNAVIKAHKEYRNSINRLDEKRSEIVQKDVTGIYKRSIISKYIQGVKLFYKLKY